MIAVFDAYGTLFDVAAAARGLAEREGAAWDWRRLAGDWRQKQLGYTWLRAAAGVHADFWQVTCDALDWALEAQGLDGDAALRGRLLDLYRRLDAYPEVPAMLRALKDQGTTAAILSNGAPEMLAAAVDSAGIADLLDAVLSVESVGVFKPATAVYDLVGRRYGVPAQKVLFISSNGWDVAFATGYGFRTVWVNRAGEPADRLPFRPGTVVPDLTGIPDL